MFDQFQLDNFLSLGGGGAGFASIFSSDCLTTDTRQICRRAWISWSPVTAAVAIVLTPAPLYPCRAVAVHLALHIRTHAAGIFPPLDHGHSLPIRTSTIAMLHTNFRGSFTVAAALTAVSSFRRGPRPMEAWALLGSIRGRDPLLMGAF